jgi:hypothetical protein
MVSVQVTANSALEWTVTDVRQTDGIVSATVLNGETAKQAAFPVEHAIGLAGDVIIDVAVAVTAAEPARRVVGGRAAELAYGLNLNCIWWDPQDCVPYSELYQPKIDKPKLLPVVHGASRHLDL